MPGLLVGVSTMKDSQMGGILPFGGGKSKLWGMETVTGRGWGSAQLQPCRADLLGYPCSPWRAGEAADCSGDVSEMEINWCSGEAYLSID